MIYAADVNLSGIVSIVEHRDPGKEEISSCQSLSTIRQDNNVI
jgi:hypothetical protein